MSDGGLTSGADRRHSAIVASASFRGRRKEILQYNLRVGDGLVLVLAESPPGAPMLLSFSSDKRGNAGIIFALSALPLIGLVGIGVDYTRAAALRTRLQESIDAAVLTYGPRSSQTNLQANVQAQVAASFQPGELTSLNVTVTPGTGILEASASATVGRVMPLLGRPTIPISTAATAKWGSQNIEVALVIDNTGSMAEAFGGTTKIAAVRTAASNFVSYLFANIVAPGTVKVALVPFDTDVNIGSANKTASWIETSTMGVYNYNYSYNQYYNQYFANGWQGCIWDRSQSYDVSNAAANDMAKSYEPDPNRKSSCSLQAMLPLTNSSVTLTTAINNMVAAGNTNLTIGLAWGFNMLTPNTPFAGAAPFGTAGVYKTVVFMTDGLNTQNRWSTTSSQIDARTAMVCTNIKAAGIEIYTVGTPDANDALLKACATNESMYYKVTSGSEISAVFNEISKKISRLRIST